MYFVSSANTPSWEPAAILNVALIIKVGQVERSQGRWSSDLDRPVFCGISFQSH